MKTSLLARIVPLAALGAALAGGVAPAQDLPVLTRRGTLRVLGVPLPDGPQFVSTVPGRPRGFDVEVLEGFGRLHKLEVQVVPLKAWSDLIPALLKGDGDVIAGGFTDTAARRQQVEFTPEVFPTRNVVLTRKPRPVAATVAGLATEKVGTIKGTSMADALARAGVPADRVDDGIPAGGLAAALKAGRVTAAVDGVESALIAMKADPALQIGAFVGPPESLAYAVRKDAPQLRAALSEYVANLRKTPTWSRLVVKYFGESAPEILRRARTSD